MHAYHAIREKLHHELRHPGCALDLKTKDFSSFCTQFKFLHCLGLIDML